MKKIAVIMNTDKIGGAERSQVLQLKYCKQSKFTFFIPNVSESKSLEKFILENIDAEIKYYNYPKSVYILSRDHIFFGFQIIFGLLNMFFSKELKLSGFDIVYLNGNKAAFFYFLTNYFNKNKIIIWHWRDYFSKSKSVRYIWKFLIKNKISSLKIICNSFSVSENLKKEFLNNANYDVIYNPSGLSKTEKQNRKLETIGLVSMLTPWKGVHEVYFFAWFFEQELRSLGVKKIRLYGDNVYETKGEHSNYKNDLKKMIEKMPTDLIEFAGLKNPETIFSEIDCLIHYSTRPEPFGRVVVEAFAKSVPVITTGLGGAGEIVEDNVTGLKTIIYDRKDLLEKIKILTDEKLNSEMTRNAYQRLEQIEKEIEFKMVRLLES